jgi:hypothetical protein
VIFKCPGQDDRNLKSEIIRCPKCAYQAEIFSDEVKIRCPGCGDFICKDRLPSCIDWCRYARECLGQEKWQRLKPGGIIRPYNQGEGHG